MRNGCGFGLELGTGKDHFGWRKRALRSSSIGVARDGMTIPFRRASVRRTSRDLDKAFLSWCPLDSHKKVLHVLWVNNFTFHIFDALPEGIRVIIVGIEQRQGSAVGFHAVSVLSKLLESG